LRIIQNPLARNNPKTSGDGGQESKLHTSRHAGKKSQPQKQTYWKRIQLHTSTSVGKESKSQKTRGHTEKGSKHKTTVANNFMK